MSASIVELPARHVGDIPRMLRHLADQIEQGKYGADAGPLVWVLDCGAEVEVGGCGHNQHH